VLIAEKKKLAANRLNEKRMAINIKPMTGGNLKTRSLIYPNKAANTIRMLANSNGLISL
jgi:hypothetical protein